MEARWTCVGCLPGDEIQHEEASGQLIITPDSEQGHLSLAGAGLNISAPLTLGKSGILNSTGGVAVLYNNEAIPVEQSDIRGGLFGAGAEEAGLLFGIIGGEKVFSGAALGTR